MRVGLPARFAFVLVALLLLAAVIRSGSKREFVRPIPGTAIGGESFANQLDLAARGDTLHVLWHVTFISRSAEPARLLYIRSADGGRHWDGRVVVGKQRGRIFAGATRLHILEGDRLEHSVSVDGGRSWTRLAALPSGPYGARGRDGLCLGDTLLVAYLAPRGDAVDDWQVTKPPGAPRRRSYLDLHVVRWDPSGLVSDQVVAGFPVNWWDPRTFVSIVRDGDRLDVFGGIDDWEEVPESTAYGMVKTHASRGKLIRCRSEDRGAHWETPQELLAGEGRASGPDDVVAVLHDSRLLVGYSGSRLLGPRTPAERESRIRLARFAPDYPEHGSRTLDIVASGKDAVAVWITGRLAGWSWAGFAENPGDALMIGTWWRQTDVFATRISDRGDLRAIADASGRRLTWSRAYASSLRAAILGRTLVCVWAGRSKVGRSHFAYGAPAELFCARVPIDRLPEE